MLVNRRIVGKEFEGGGNSHASAGGRGWPDHTSMSLTNSDAGSTLVTSKWSLARVQAT